MSDRPTSQPISAAEDRLIELELQALAGARTADRPLGQGVPRTAPGWRVAWAAVLLVGGIAVLWGVSRAVDEPGADRRSGVPAVAGMQDPAGVNGDPAPRPFERGTRVRGSDGFESLAVEARSVFVDEARAGDLTPLAGFRSLESVVVSGSKTRGAVAIDAAETVRAVVGLPALRALELENLTVGSPDVLRGLAAHPRLEHVSLRGSCWAGAVAALGELSALWALELWSFSPTEEDVAALQAMSGLRHLTLAGIRELGGAEIRELIEALPNLQSIRLSGVAIDTGVVRALAAAEGLVGVDLAAPYRSAPELFDPLLEVTRWRRLMLRYHGTLDAEQLASLSRMSALHTLGFGNGGTLQSHWTPPDGFFEVLAELPELRVLDFRYGYSVHADMLEPLVGRPLERIVVHPRGIRDTDRTAAAEQVQAWFPAAEVAVLTAPRQTMEVLPTGGLPR